MKWKPHHKQVEYKGVYYMDPSNTKRVRDGQELNRYIADSILALRVQLNKKAEAEKKFVLADTIEQTITHNDDGGITLRMSAWTINRNSRS